MEDRLLKIEEVAKIINYKISSLYQLIYRKLIPVIKISGRSVRFSEKEIKEWIQSKSQPAISPQPNTNQGKGRGKPRKAGGSVSSEYINKLVSKAKEEVGI